MQLHNQRYIAFRASACFILHDMNVSDRVMGDCRAGHKPCASIDQVVRAAYNVRQVFQPSDLMKVQDKFKAIYEELREGNTREDVREWVIQTRGERFRELCDLYEFQRLHKALRVEEKFMLKRACALALAAVERRVFMPRTPLRTLRGTSSSLSSLPPCSLELSLDPELTLASGKFGTFVCVSNAPPLSFFPWLDLGSCSSSF